MPETKADLLIVDDEPLIRVSLSQIFMENGYSARSAADGLSALDEIRRQAPEILISDLNMSGMSGFELLPVVRRRFPRIRLIAMSGAFSGNEVPSGVTADAFYYKGGGLGTLLSIVESLPRPERKAQQPHAAPAPVWITRHRRNAAGEGYLSIECPECLKTFPQVLHGAIGSERETNCIYCGSPVHYVTSQPENQTFLSAFHDRYSSRTSALQPGENQNYEAHLRKAKGKRQADAEDNRA
ncbi:MAG: response regulator [Terracidiphilus sp.]|jgi:CheY-like chemotaxis protein